MKYTSFDKTNLDGLRATVNAKLKELEELTGLTIKMTSITYGSTELTGKLEVKIDSPEAKAQRDRLSNSMMSYSGLQVGDRLFHKGKSYVVESYNPNSRKRPVTARCLLDNKMSAWPFDLARQCKVS